MTESSTGDDATLRTLVAARLEPGETVRWMGRRKPVSTVLTPAGIVWRAYGTCFGLAVVYGLAAATRPISTPVLVTGVFFLLFAAVPVVLIVRQHWSKLRSETLHAITDRRLITITPGLSTATVGIPLALVKGVQRFDAPSGLGTIVIDYANGMNDGRWLKETESWGGLFDASGAEDAIIEHWLVC